MSKLARGVYHASLFETAFHNNTNNDLDKFSTGAYIYPDTTYMTLADFAAQPQAQTREAAILARVKHLVHGGGGRPTRRRPWPSQRTSTSTASRNICSTTTGCLPCSSASADA